MWMSAVQDYVKGEHSITYLQVKSGFHSICFIHMGEISQGVQSLNLMSYLSGVLGPFFGDLGLCYGKN